jgi:hypothetical protein
MCTLWFDVAALRCVSLFLLILVATYNMIGSPSPNTLRICDEMAQLFVVLVLYVFAAGALHARFVRTSAKSWDASSSESSVYDNRIYTLNVSCSSCAPTCSRLPLLRKFNWLSDAKIWFVSVLLFALLPPSTIRVIMACCLVLALLDAFPQPRASAWWFFHYACSFLFLSYDEDWFLSPATLIPHLPSEGLTSVHVAGCGLSRLPAVLSRNRPEVRTVCRPQTKRAQAKAGKLGVWRGHERSERNRGRVLPRQKRASGGLEAARAAVVG